MEAQPTEARERRPSELALPRSAACESSRDCAGASLLVRSQPVNRRAPRARETTLGSLLEDLLLVRAIGDQVLQPHVRRFDLTRPAQSRPRAPTLFSYVESRVADSRLSAVTTHWCPAHRPADGVDDLLYRLLRPLHRRADKRRKCADSKLLLYFPTWLLFLWERRYPSSQRRLLASYLFGVRRGEDARKQRASGRHAAAPLILVRRENRVNQPGAA